MAGGKAKTDAQQVNEAWGYVLQLAMAMDKMDLPDVCPAPDAAQEIVDDLIDTIGFLGRSAMTGEDRMTLVDRIDELELLLDMARPNVNVQGARYATDRRRMNTRLAWLNNRVNELKEETQAAKNDARRLDALLVRTRTQAENLRDELRTISADELEAYFTQFTDYSLEGPQTDTAPPAPDTAAQNRRWFGGRLSAKS